MADTNPPATVQDDLDALELHGLIVKTGEIRQGKPVYAATEKGLAYQELTREHPVERADVTSPTESWQT